MEIYFPAKKQRKMKSLNPEEQAEIDKEEQLRQIAKVNEQRMKEEKEEEDING